MRPAAPMRFVLAARCVSRSRVWVLAVSCADDWRWSSRVGWEARCEAKVQLGSAVPHTFDAWGEAMDGLLVAFVVVYKIQRRVGRGLSGVRASSYKVGSSCALRVVDGIADLPRYVPKVA
jgi:hypothetical protein